MWNSWKALEIAPITIETIAHSDPDGEVSLGIPAGYEGNWGVASLELEGSIPVKISRLDSLDFGGAGVMKVDVEGQ